MNNRTLLFPLALFLLLSLAACDDGDTVGPDPVELETIRVEDLPADPTSAGGGPGAGTGRYTFFSLRDGEIVLSYDNESRADSASTEWDIAVQGTNVLVNGGTSGPGQGAGYVAEGAFEEVTEVDTERLDVDDAGAGAGQYAIPQGSGNGWYSYNAGGENYIRPVPGRTIVIRTADGEGYAKIRILSYYLGNPELPTDREAHPSRYYTFEYVYQPEGTSFE